MIAKLDASAAVRLTLIVTFVIKRAEVSPGEVSWRYREEVSGVLVQADEEKGARTRAVCFSVV